jgi:hypothetical protein
MKGHGGQKQANFFELLSPTDQLQYTELSHRLSNRSNRYARFRRFQTFEESFDAIRSFCVRRLRLEALLCLRPLLV